MRTYILEAKCEILSLTRMPRFVFATVLLPILFYIFFGLVMAGTRDPKQSMATYLLSTYSVIGVMSAALYGVGAGIANEKAMGWMEVKQASPMPPLAYFTAKFGAAILFSMIITTLLFTIGVVFGGARLEPVRWLSLAGVMVIGTIPFYALGMALGYSMSGNSAGAVVNLISLPLSAFSGLWVPIDFLPKGVQQIAEVLPTYHLAQIGLSVAGWGSRGSIGWHVSVLLIATAAFCILAFLAWRRDRLRSSMGY